MRQTECFFSVGLLAMYISSANLCGCHFLSASSTKKDQSSFDINYTIWYTVGTVDWLKWTECIYNFRMLYMLMLAACVWPQHGYANLYRSHEAERKIQCVCVCFSVQCFENNKTNIHLKMMKWCERWNAAMWNTV